MKKPLKTAAVCGILLLAVSFIIAITVAIFTAAALIEMGAENYSDYSFIPEWVFLFSAIGSLVTLPFAALFFYGFAVLGKRFNNQLVFVLAWVFIIVTLLGGILNLISIFAGDIYPKPQASFDSENPSFSGIFSTMKQNIINSPIYAPIFRIVGDSDVFFWAFLAIITLGSFALYIIFGVGIIKLRKNGVPLALATGVFYLITPLWALFSLVASILAIILLFKSSRKFESGKKEKTEEKPKEKPAEKTRAKKSRKK